MDGRTRQDGADVEEGATDRQVSVCETRPGRVVFTERDNTDAWIATDLAVDVRR